MKWANVAASAQAQLATIEEARHTTDVLQRERAKLSVHFEPVGTNSHMLVVRNEGPATASHVTIDLAPRRRRPQDAPQLIPRDDRARR